MPKFVSLFPVWAIALSCVAFFYPDPFVFAKPAIIPLLALVMFSMGLTLTLEHFKQTLKLPKVILLAISLQFLFMPFLGYWLATILQLPEEQLVGMVLVGSSAGGTASNVICYLARGNVPLSILMTLSSTLCAVVLMPGLTWVYLNQIVQVPILEMTIKLCLMVLIPVLSGTAINSLFTEKISHLQSLFPKLSCLSIIFIIAIIVGLNQSNLANPNLALIIAVILHNCSGAVIGYALPRYFSYDKTISRTVCIEVAMQNSGLSVALAIKYFSTLTALPGALFSIWHNISGALLATYWHHQEPE